MARQTIRVPAYLIVLGYLPLVLILIGVALAAQANSALVGLVAFLAWIYLVPPLSCRLVLLHGSPLCDGARHEDAAFKRWWLLTQLQMPFNRVPFLEELLRLVPGLYSAWLNLWGAKVSVMTFWARDVLISERYLLTIEPAVTVASQVGITAHVVTPDARGDLRLIVAPVVVERGAMLGIRSGLGPGCRVFAGELLPAGRMLPPNSGWRNGRKFKLGRADADD